MKLNLLTKMLLLILIPALLGVCTASWLSYRAAESALQAQIVEEMTLVIERQKSELVNVTTLLRNTLRNTSRIARLHLLLRELDAGASAERLTELKPGVLTALQDVSQNFEQIESSALLDTTGRIIVHTNAKMLGEQRGDRGYFKKALRGELAVENLISRSTGAVSTILAVPVKVDGKIMGVLFASLDIPQISRTTTDTIKMGRSGVCYVYSGQGVLLMHPNKSYVGNDNSSNDWTRRMIDQRDGRIAYSNRGKERIAYFRYIPDMDWSVAVAVERDEMFAPVTSMLQRNLLVVCCSALLVGLLIFLVARDIALTLTQGSHLVGQVAEGHLELSPEQARALGHAEARGDEIGALARGIHGMMENIKKLFDEGRRKTALAEQATEEAHRAVAEAEQARHDAENARREGMLAAAGQLESVVGIISSASTQLSAQIGQSEQGAVEQAARATQTATAMEEMTGTVVVVAKNAGTASDVSARTRAQADEGAAIVEKAVTSIRQVRQESLVLKEDMGVLADQAQAVSRIMSVISDIADQTNLLALNAAIEAARAGEAGRGFAVVADEVRKLAEKTMASTTDVGDAITSIQNSAAKSMEQVDRAVKSIEEATDFANRSGEALKEIVTMADATADQVRSIATASEEQSASSEEINKSITQVNTIAGETAQAMEEAARAVNDLAGQAQVLAGLIEDMKRE